MSEADITLQRTVISLDRLGGKRSGQRSLPRASQIGLRSRRNERIAAKLLEAADLLAGQRANPFRVAAYRRAAEAIARLDRDVGELFAERGRAGLEDALAIGPTLSAAIGQMIKRGRWGFLDRLRRSIDPAQIFQGIPGVGPALADKFHRDLHLDTLEALEAATYDGRVDRLDAVIISRSRDPSSESPCNIFGLGAAFEHMCDRTLAERQALQAVSADWGEAPKIFVRNCARAIDANDHETANFFR